MIDNLHEDIEGLKKKRRDIVLIVEAKAQGVKLARQLEEVESHLIKS